MIGIIAAVSSNGVIGVNNKIPWSYPEDMKFFKNTTIHSVVIMGRRTFESLEKPLPKRENIVITSRKIEIPDITCMSSVRAVVERESIIMRDKPKDIWLIGGASIYEEGMEYADKILLTLTPDVELRTPAVRFPWVNPQYFNLTNISVLSEEKKLSIATYERVISK